MTVRKSLIAGQIRCQRRFGAVPAPAPSLGFPPLVPVLVIRLEHIEMRYEPMLKRRFWPEIKDLQKNGGKEKYIWGGTPLSILHRCSGWLGSFGRRVVAQRALRNLGSVEQDLGIRGADGADEHAVGDTCDEVADSIAA